MNNIFDIKTKKSISAEEVKVQTLLKFSEEVDQLIFKYHNKKCDLGELACILANRQGELLRILPDNIAYFDFIIEIMIKQSGLTEV